MPTALRGHVSDPMPTQSRGHGTPEPCARARLGRILTEIAAPTRPFVLGAGPEFCQNGALENDDRRLSSMWAQAGTVPMRGGDVQAHWLWMMAGRVPLGAGLGLTLCALVW